MRDAMGLLSRKELSGAPRRPTWSQDGLRLTLTLDLGQGDHMPVLRVWGHREVPHFRLTRHYQEWPRRRGVHH